MDYNTIRDLKNKVKKFVVPAGIDSILRGWDVEDDKINTVRGKMNLPSHGKEFLHPTVSTF